MLEKREVPWIEGAQPAGVDEEEEADEQEVEESADAFSLTAGFFRPWRITTNVSKPSAEFITNCKDINTGKKN